MPSAGWLCRRVACGRRNPATTQKCPCGAKRPKRRVPAHRKALRDVTYEGYVELSAAIHGVSAEECCVCGKERGESRHHRDHEHSPMVPWYGEPRGIACIECNILMPPKMTPERARQIAAYLTRVEGFYTPEAEAA